MNELSERYFFGLGTTRDYVAAARWLWQATQVPTASSAGSSWNPAESPHVFDAIVRGKVRPDSTERRRLHEATELVHRGLGLNESDALRRIGEMYRDGSPLTPQAPIEAWAWLNRASQLNNAEARAALTDLEKSLSPDQLDAAKRRFLPKVQAPSALARP